MKKFVGFLAAFFIGISFPVCAAQEPMMKFSFIPVFEDSSIHIYNESGNILESSGAAVTNLTDFEWQFTFECENPATVNTAFCFHINERSEASSYKNRKNLFSVTLYGSDYSSDKANFQVPDALVVEYPNSSVGAMRPYKYKTAEKPWRTDKSSYIKLDDRSAEPIDLSRPVTVNIKMNGSEIILSVWAADDAEKNTYRELTVSMYKTAVETAPGGDFKIISQNSGDLRAYDMKISEYKLVKNENYIAKNNSANGIWDLRLLYVAVGCFVGVIVIVIAVISVIYRKPKRRKQPE